MTLQQKIRSGLGDKRIVVIGDAVADQFLEGTISRVSREAPVFILRHDETTTLPGGAANAAANVAALGAQAILLGYIGDDRNGHSLRDSLEECHVDTTGLLSVPGISTTTKVRVLAGHAHSSRQQVIRIDYEDASTIAAEYNAALLAKFKDIAEGADAIVISDYGYGVVSTAVFDEAKRFAKARGIPLVIDSRHRLEEFTGATTATPNTEEVEQVLGQDFTVEDCSRLRDRLGLEALLVTNGNKGMTLLESGKDPRAIPAVGAAQPVDGTGAGDTVIAAYTVALAAGMSFREAAEIANHAGGIVVMKKGTATVTTAELFESLSSAEQASLAQSK
jgi:rfaE bifunctional protein kinase chain/domain